MRPPYFYSLFFLYFLTRLLNLTSLPIFNDESIHLHWGQIMVSVPGQAFYSLFDSKPPLILWLWGYAEKLISDPLIAGRLVTILFGALTLVGLIKTARLLKFSQRGILLAGLLYILNPLTLFFDRLVLFDSPVSAVFVWVLYLSIKISIIPNSQLPINIFLLGLAQGFGLWVKGNSQFFLFLPFVIPLLTAVFKKDREKAMGELKYFFISLLLAQILFLPIYLNPQYNTFSGKVTGFLLPANEIFSPLRWISYSQLWLWTVIVFLSPLVLLSCFLGFWRFFKADKIAALVIAAFTLLPIAAEIMTIQQMLSRYYLFTLIGFFLFSAYGLATIKKFPNINVFAVLITPTIMSFFLLLNPLYTLNSLNIITPLRADLSQYISGWTSGYGVKEATDWLGEQAKDKPVVVITRADSGNPEDAVFVYLGKNKNILLLQANRKPSPQELLRFRQYPIYFVSRGKQYLDMEKELTEMKIFPKPQGEEFVGIYQLHP
ncbi:MAG: glycosyltransferase family 39 protein [bacterium]|nr:glycosyltransferase family 39 protein [bacterium]